MDKIAPGKYIIAVSGGVDSMVLLDKLRQLDGLDLIVAHADHGIRKDSYVDRELVAKYAREHKLVCITTELKLGERASETDSRIARYKFLRQCRKKYNAAGIIVAHHQDDLIETAIIAIMRGTGWRGLAPFVNSPDLIRPLLGTTKEQLIAYARKHYVPWREDVTNIDERYLRNYVRATLVPTLDQKSDTWRNTFLQLIHSQQALRSRIEEACSTWLKANATGVNSALRYSLIMLPQSEAYELLQYMVKRATGNTIERRLAEMTLVFIKVGLPHKIMQLSKNYQLRLTMREFIVEPRTPVVSYNKH